MYAEKIFLGLGFESEETEVGINFSRADLEVNFDIFQGELQIIDNSDGDTTVYNLTADNPYPRTVLLPNYVPEEVAEAVVAIAMEIRKDHNLEDWNLQVDISQEE